MNKNRWHQKYDSLPEELVEILKGIGGRCWLTYDFKKCDLACMDRHLCKSKCAKMIFAYPEQKGHDVATAFDQLFTICSGLSVPAEHPEEVVITSESVQVVEIAAWAEEDKCAWDTPCRYGYHVIGHAVYCHFEVWPGRPRKCRREWEGDEKRFEDCPGFYPNKNYKKDDQASS